MDLANDLGAGQRQQIVVSFQIFAATVSSMRRIVGVAIDAMHESMSAKIGFLQRVLLDHCAHGAIDDEDALGQRRFQQRGALWIFVGEQALLECPHMDVRAVARDSHYVFTACNEITSKCGARFSRVTALHSRTFNPAFSAIFDSSRGLKPRLL